MAASAALASSSATAIQAQSVVGPPEKKQKKAPETVKAGKQRAPKNMDVDEN